MRAINLNPNSTRALAVRGYLYRKKGDLDRAIVDYGEIIRIDPKSDDAHMFGSNASPRRPPRNGDAGSASC